MRVCLSRFWCLKLSDSLHRKNGPVDTPHIQSVGVKPNDLLTRSSEIVPDVGLAHFMVSVKHDGGSASQIPLGSIVKTAVGVIELGKQ